MHIHAAFHPLLAPSIWLCTYTQLSNEKSCNIKMENYQFQFLEFQIRLKMCLTDSLMELETSFEK